MFGSTKRASSSVSPSTRSSITEKPTVTPLNSDTNTRPATICSSGILIASGLASSASRSPSFVRDARSCNASRAFCSVKAAVRMMMLLVTGRLWFRATRPTRRSSHPLTGFARLTGTAGGQLVINPPFHSKSFLTGINEFYKKGCQEKSSASTGGREDFVSRSSPLHCKSASRFAREVWLLSCLPFLWLSSSGGDHAKRVLRHGKREGYLSGSRVGGGALSR